MADEPIPGQLSLFSPGALLDERKSEKKKTKPAGPGSAPPSDPGEVPAPGAAPGVGAPAAIPAKKRYVVFDLETKKSFDMVGGRNNLHKLEVSVAVAYDSATDTFPTYREPELPALVELLKAADYVVGFNIVGFDFPVLQPYTDFDLFQLPAIDLMLGLEHVLGYRIGLDKVASATLGTGKSGHGLQAIEWFQKGEWDLLIQYCRQDVKVTKELYEFARDQGHLLIPAAGSTRRVDLRVMG